MTRSLRRELSLSVVGISLFAWCLAAALAYWAVGEQVNERMDAQLAQTARAMLALSLHEVHEERLFALSEGAESRFGEAIAPDDWGAGSHEEHNLAFQVWIERDRLALRSHNAPLLPLSHRNQGFSDVLVNGDPWRVYSIQTADGEIRVQLGERLSVRTALMNALVAQLIIPLLIFTPLLVAGVSWAVRRALDFLPQASAGLSHPESPSVDVAHFPEELRPLASALERLLERLEEVRRNERRFTSDAAHELRTPLAALKTQAEVALRTPDPEQRKQALRQMIKGVNRATHLIDQLLTLARLSPEHGRADERPVDLFILAEEVLSELAPEALDKDIELALHGRRGCFAWINREALAVLLRNLVINAIRYTPKGGQVDVEVRETGKHIELMVCDSGPGIPEHERERVFQRFYRGLGTRAPGSGLGLSIVQRIAALNALEVRLGESVLGGLKVSVHLRRAMRPPPPDQSG